VQRDFVLPRSLAGFHILPRRCSHAIGMLDEEAIGKSARCLCLRARWASFKEFLWENFSQPELALIFRLRGSVIPKAMIFAVPSGILAGVLHWFMALTGNQLSTVAQGSQIWSSFNFVLGVLIVFRTNQAYARYWEGATLLQQVRGEWFNATSSLFAFCTSEKRYRDDVDKFQHHVVRLMSMLYCSGLQQVALITDDKMEIIDNEGLDPEALKFLMRGVDRCEIVLQWVQRLIKDALESGVVNIPPPILSRTLARHRQREECAKNRRDPVSLPVYSNDHGDVDSPDHVDPLVGCRHKSDLLVGLLNDIHHGSCFLVLELHRGRDRAAIWRGPQRPAHP